MYCFQAKFKRSRYDDAKMPEKHTVCATNLTEKEAKKYGTINQYYYPKWKIIYRYFKDAQHAVGVANGNILGNSRIEVNHDTEKYRGEWNDP
jgi:hypothetical protein